VLTGGGGAVAGAERRLGGGAVAGGGAARSLGSGGGARCRSDGGVGCGRLRQSDWRPQRWARRAPLRRRRSEFSLSVSGWGRRRRGGGLYAPPLVPVGGFNRD
jgi:hypothetical protein